MQERRIAQRRVGVRGYGLDRRQATDSLYLGLDRRKGQRRKHDRRCNVRREDDLPYESQIH
jgi:hypothetical protein